MAVVIASNLRKEFAGTVLFDGVSFKLERRDRLALAGPNGAGKTTLMRMLMGETTIEGCELVLDPGTRGAGDQPASEQIDGSLSMPWLCGRLGVTVAARPWSSTRADLVLAPIGGHRLRYPRRWFSVGFTLADEMRRRVMLPTG